MKAETPRWLASSETCRSEELTNATIIAGIGCVNMNHGAWLRGLVMPPFIAFIATVCAMFVAPAVAQANVEACPGKGQFKGVELYSWQSAPADEWVFALLPGTNRAKTEREIRHQNRCILSADELAFAFERLGHEDEVFWIENKSLNMRLPARDLIERVVALAKSRGFVLHVPPRIEH